MGDISIFDLKAAQDRVKTPYFVETGTLYGGGVEFAYKQGFEEIHSIEIEPFLAQQAKEKFKAFPNIHIHEGKSFEVLEQLLPEIKDNITFWLDAHFPGADAHMKTYESCLNLDVDTNLPLEREIELISKRTSSYTDVLIVDDLWIYEPIKINGIGFNEHSSNHGHKITREQLMNGKDLGFLYNNFDKTHDFKKVFKHQGYVIVKPKNE